MMFAMRLDDVSFEFLAMLPTISLRFSYRLVA